MANWLVKSYWSAFVLWNLRREADLPFWPLERVLGIQNRRIRSIVKHAYEYVPFYRDAMLKGGLRPEDLRTAQDLERLPLVSKDQLVHEPERFRSRYYQDRNGLTLRSSGTTGLGVAIRTDAKALFLALAHGHRSRLAMAPFVGRRIGYREAEIIRFASVNSQMRRYFDAHSWTPKGIDLRRLTVDIDAPYAENLAALDQFRPDVVVGYGSYLGAYFRWLNEQGLDFHRPKLLYYGGDRMPDADRIFIEQELGVPVWSSYQATEALRLAYQCELRQGFHVSLDQVAVRVLDPAGNPVGPGGTGECVISNLTNRATVMLNLRLGDIVTLASDACPCGRTLPCIERIEGRSDDLIQRPDGSATSAYGILHRLQEVPEIGQVQLVQQELGRFHLRVVNSPKVDWPEARPRLESVLRSVLGDDIHLTIEPVDRIPPEPGGKVRAAISHCKG
jgi:phenylacetate-CoA ligase